MELWEVMARESIRDLVARYNANGDSGRFAEVRRLFTARATMDIGDGRTYSGVDEIMTIFTQTKDGTGRRQGLTHVRHTTSTHQIDLIDSENVPSSSTRRGSRSNVQPASTNRWYDARVSSTLTAVRNRPA